MQETVARTAKQRAVVARKASRMSKRQHQDLRSLVRILPLRASLLTASDNMLFRLAGMTLIRFETNLLADKVLNGLQRALNVRDLVEKVPLLLDESGLHELILAVQLLQVLQDNVDVLLLLLNVLVNVELNGTAQFE